jgi:tetratricopeptide (TPR) repeat protein
MRIAPFLVGLLAVVALPAGLSEARAQIPDEFTNLKVLPKDIEKGELVGMMRDIATGLGVRCNHCHVGPENLQGMDFATDEKEAKRTAREMLRMVQAINDQHLAKLETSRDTLLEVECATCHRSQSLPRFIEDVVAEVLEAQGAEAATGRYRELREEHYGGFTYDFSEAPLNDLGERLARAEKWNEALAVLTLNVEFNPESIWTRMLMASVHLRMGDKAKALQVAEKALAIEPDNAWIKRRIEQIKAAE